MITLIIDSVRINLENQRRVVILKTLDQQRSLFLWIAHAEAYAIATELEHTKQVRPMTHDLLKTIIEGTGLKLNEVRIVDIQDEIFYAEIVLERDGQIFLFDARPSDAIALAIRVQAPILIEESVLERQGFTEEQLKERAKTAASIETDSGPIPEQNEQDQPSQESTALSNVIAPHPPVRSWPLLQREETSR